MGHRFDERALRFLEGALPWAMAIFMAAIFFKSLYLVLTGQ